ncbi:centrosomal protein of 295 kDa isoform X2 [Sceloporus undulatus]|uniref:centrosomal protein of 295 kDa isoform X2 n=1 Tax=Sceloporus undulatus TaxID=8520 RepID=UPI001C4AA77A|nr:centrosomal protein of 295 kDa isoform X2 [Sceloporus undulatus]
MKRKVARAGRLRLSPNEETQLLKEEHERRRKLRLQQVREQERNIALQIRQEVKQRRDEQLHQLAEKLKAEWQKAQEEKIKALENLYLSSLRAVGEGHRQAKENEPDLEALARQAEERRKRAEKRHAEALKELKNQKERLLKEQTWRANARRHAFNVEKERAAKIASLPPPPPPPFENIDLKTTPTVKVCNADTFSITHHHLFEPHVDREMDTEQPDARLLAEDATKQTKGLQNNKERERREQLEKARLRGKHALKMVHLAQDREKLMKELEQMQIMDLARRRQIVAQMPPQLFEPAYRRVELKEEWQRELECAFEDMYTGDRKMQGDLILHLDPQPLPTLSDRSQDDDLELSQEPDSECEVPARAEDEVKDSEPGGSEVDNASQLQSKLALKKLLNKIRNQKDHWTSKEESEASSEIGTIESGTISSRERRLCESEPEQEPKGATVCETKELPETLDQTVVAGNVVLNHPQEQAAKIRKESERQLQMEWLEHQKQEQLTLLQQIEEQKIRLEVDFQMAQMQHQEQKVETEPKKKDKESQTGQMNDTVSVAYQLQKVEQQPERDIDPEAASFSKEDSHIQMIRDYQQRLLRQNRIHRESIEEARKQLHEYQNKLKERYQSVSAALFSPADRVVPVKSDPLLPSQLQRREVLQRVHLTADHPSKNPPVQKPPEHSEVLLEQKGKEGVLDFRSEKQIQPVCSQENKITFQLTHQQKEKLATLKTHVTQPCDLHQMPGSVTFKSQDTSIPPQPVALAKNVQFIKSADSTSQPSEMLFDKLVPHVPLVEKTLLPTSLKHQHISAESKIRTALDQTSLPPVQPDSSMPFSVASEKTQECLALRNGSEFFSGYSDIVQLRDRMLASSESIQAQQEHLKELQEQLDEQREALLSRQRIQEDLLMEKHAQLKQQMERQQEALKEFLKRAEESSKYEEMTQAQETSNSSLLTSLLKEANRNNQQEVRFSDLNSLTPKEVAFQNVDSAGKIESFQKTGGKEQKLILSKPPLAKVKLGLDLEQHELSIIPELDTPRSGILSATDKLELSKSPLEFLHEETDILRITAGNEQSCSTSQDQLQESRCEKSVMDADGLLDSAHSLMDQGLRSYGANMGRRANSDSSFRTNSMVVLRTAWSPDSLNARTPMQQVACGYFASSTVSPASITTSYNPDRSLESREPCSSKEQIRHFSSSIEEKANDAWSPSVSLLHRQQDPSEFLHSQLSFGEVLHCNESKIQQNIDKYTRDFSWSSLSSYDPAVGHNATDIERHFPNFHRELFQSLEPSPDFSISSSFSQCKVSHSSKDLSKSSDLSKSHELTASNLEERSNSFSFLSTGKLSNTLPTDQTDEELKEKMQGAEESSEQLHMDSALTPLMQSADNPRAFVLIPEHTLEIRKSIEHRMYTSPESVQYEELEGNEKNIDLHSSIENFRSLSPVEDGHSFYQLIPDPATVKNTIGRTESLKEDMCAREESMCFVELTSTFIERENETNIENVIMNENVEINLSQCTLHTVEEQSSLKTDMLSLAQEMNSKLSLSPVQNSGLQSESDMFQQRYHCAGQVKSSDSFLSQSNIPVWEKLTGRGIMEESELTLISSTDNSTAVESDLELCIQTESGKEKSENLPNSDHFAIKSSPESGRFLPLRSEVDDSISTQNDQPSVIQSSQEDCDRKNKSEVAHTSLQESFLKRKKDFIERSSKRVENLKRKERSSEKPQTKASQQKKAQLQKPKEKFPPSGSTVSYLKKVEAVKVCTAEDRRSVEIQMHQRTSREHWKN